MKIEDRERLVRVEEAVFWIKKEMAGNGCKGLIERVRSLENWKYYITGGLAVVVLVFSLVSSKLGGVF